LNGANARRCKSPKVQTPGVLWAANNPQIWSLGQTGQSLVYYTSS
jgi:hypothetical protein